MKLGEALIGAGLITRQQLNTALERQAVLGGRIDTNIVELRFLSDERLTAFLGKFLGLPVVDPEALNSIPGDVIRILRKDLVENYMLIPFALDRQRLRVAMLNPKNIKDIDNLRFTTGYEIIPYVITESRLFHVLGKYYGIKRETRYISLKDRFDPGSDVDLSDRIERICGGAGPDRGDSRKNVRQLDSISPQEREEGDKTGPGVLEALLLNAIYTAKLFYARQGLTPRDGLIEENVLAEWEGLAERLHRGKKGRTCH